MYLKLLNHHVLRCIGCGRVQMSSARDRVKCFSCGRSWALCQRGETVGVLDSFWLSSQATACAQAWKARIEPSPVDFANPFADARRSQSPAPSPA